MSDASITYSEQVKRHLSDVVVVTGSDSQGHTITLATVVVTYQYPDAPNEVQHTMFAHGHDTDIWSLTTVSGLDTTIDNPERFGPMLNEEWVQAFYA